MHHYKIQQAKCETYVERPALEAKIRAHINDLETRVPLVVHGQVREGRDYILTFYSFHLQSGCGKTSIMAKVAKDAKMEHPNAVVVYRFLGM